MQGHSQDLLHLIKIIALLKQIQETLDKQTTAAVCFFYSFLIKVAFFIPYCHIVIVCQMSISSRVLFQAPFLSNCQSSAGSCSQSGLVP